MSAPRGSSWIRAERAALVADGSLGGRAFGIALAGAVDDVFRSVLATVGTRRAAVVALGSYARRELCPGSDIDVLLLHDRRSDVEGLADALWYPLWDAGFVLGHATRTPRETVKLAGRDLDTLTALLDVRIVGGDLDDEVRSVVAQVRSLARRRRRSLVDQLADASALRTLRPGPVAEMLEPHLKDGAGGLRDVHALGWAGWTVDGPGGLESLVAAGILRPDDLAVLAAATDTLLDARVALHRVTGGSTEVLALQEQDAVASACGYADADDLMRGLAAAARRVAWIVDDAWDRLRAPGGASRARAVDDGLVLERNRIRLGPDAVPSAALLLRAARLSATAGVDLDRDALVALRAAPAPTWTDAERDDFLAVLRAGRRTVDVFTTLDHEDLVTRLLPEWEHVRSRPQRNAYHRFTVDRHLVETVAEAGALLDDPGPGEARPVEDLDRPALLLLGALLHDIAKGRPGDHAVLGAAMARDVGTRLGLDPRDTEDLAWLVRDHLLMADTATRRDLADRATVEQFCARVGNRSRLALLTVLTVADSRATGPAAWGAGKAALVRELHDRAAAHLEGVRRVEPEDAATDARLAGPGVVVEWETLEGGRLRCSVGASDRPGLLAGVAGALSLEGFDIESASAHPLPGARAAEVFVGTDTFGRLAGAEGRDRAEATVGAVLAGERAVADELAARRAAYASRRRPTDESVRLRIVPDASADATVVEVYAPDEIGLLATVAGVFAELGLDVARARVATTGEAAVDVFYVRDRGGRLAGPDRVADLERTLLARLRPGDPTSPGTAGGR